MNARLLAQIDTTPPPAPADGPWPTEVLFFTQIPCEDGLRLQADGFEKIAAGSAPGHLLVLTEHPPTWLAPTEDAARRLCDAAPAEIAVLRDEQARAAEWTGPGVLTTYLVYHLDHGPEEQPVPRDADAFVTRVEDLLLAVLRDFGVEGERQTDGRSIRVGGRTVATIRTRVRRWIALVRFTINTNADPVLAAGLRRAGFDSPPTASLTDLGLDVERQDDVREAVVRHYEALFRARTIVPQRAELKTSKPPWLRARLPTAPGTEQVHQVMRTQRLHTVCESAHCPNMGECWSHGTATFMINGNVCTRSCSFCAVFTGRPLPLDPDEPRRVAAAAEAMRLSYVVVTAVNRDERADGGAAQFAATIRALREQRPGIRVEVLIPDFKGDADALETVFRERPDVLNHNTETVPRLYRRVRPQARYERTLDVLRRAKAAGLVTKSGIMLGLGEEDDEVRRVLHDLRAHGCDIVTIGQYLRPSEKHHPVVRYVSPTEFAAWKRYGEDLGFTTVESGPLVRSSYHAHESFGRHQRG